MKKIFLLVSSLLAIVQVNGQITCPETIMCKDQVTPTMSYLSNLNPLSFLEMEGEEYDACLSINPFEFIITDKNGLTIIESTDAFKLDCTLEDGVEYDVTINRVTTLEGGTKEFEHACSSKIIINDAEGVCPANRGIFDPTTLSRCEDSKLIGMAGDLLEANVGDFICVPFRAKNFQKFLGFQAELVWYPEVLTFTEVKTGAIPLTSDHYNVKEAHNGTVGFVWSASDVINGQITVDDNTTLFEICFEVIGDEGDFSPIEIVGLRGNLEIITDDNDLIVVDEYCLTPSVVTISGTNNFDSAFTMTLNNLDIKLQDFNNGQISSSLLVDGDNTIKFFPTETSNFLDLISGGISTLDLVIGIKMFVTDEPIDPLSAIALDVDYNGGINVKDLVLIRQLILGQRRDLPNPGFFFIERSETFSHSFDEFDFGFFDTYIYDRSVIEQGELHFDVYKYGDLSRGQFSGENEAEIRSNNTNYISFDNQYVQAGMPVSVKFAIDSEGGYEINGFQSALDMIGADIVEINHNYFGDEFFFHLTEDQKLNLLFASKDSKEKIEFEIVAEFDTDGYLVDKISLSQDHHVELVNSDLSVSNLELLPKSIKPKEFKIIPNPFAEYTRIHIPKEFVGGNLFLTNVLGAKIYNSRILDDVFMLTSDAIGRSGVYLVTLESETQTLTKRLVFQE